MTSFLACIQFDAATEECVQETWVVQPSLLPPLPAAEGLQISAAMITVCATAWSYKAIRRYMGSKA